MRNEKCAIWPVLMTESPKFPRVIGNRGRGIRIAEIAAQLSNGLVNSAMGQIPCSTERISSFKLKLVEQLLSLTVININRTIWYQSQVGGLP